MAVYKVTIEDLDDNDFADVEDALIDMGLIYKYERTG